MPIPESIEMYPGTSGNTHGDKNEISPARNAPAKETSVIPDSSSLQAHTLWNISRQFMLFRRTQTATTPNCLVGQRCFKGGKFTRVVGCPAINRKSGAEPPRSISAFVFSHIPRCLFASDGDADNLLTVSGGALFRGARLFNARRGDPVTDTEAKGRQMKVLDGGWRRSRFAALHLSRPLLMSCGSQDWHRRCILQARQSIRRLPED